MNIATEILLLFAAVFFIVLFFVLLSKPIKWFFKLLINAIFGFLLVDNKPYYYLPFFCFFL